MKKTIPFLPFPLPVMKRIAKRFYVFGEKLNKMMPGFDVILNQAHLDFKSREYMSIAFFAFIFWTFMTLALMLFLAALADLPESFKSLIIPLPLVMGGISFFYITMYPRLIITRKIKDLDKNLLFALRHLLIQVKSGVPLFDGLISVSNGNYSSISTELKECTKRMSTGLGQTESLEELALKNPSLNFRRVVWQITSSLRTGADLGNTLDSIVNNLADEQKVAIRRYGSQLNPLAMMYMMLAVIIPSLGITFVIIFSSFSNVPISESMFYLVLFMLAFFQFIFIGIVKSRRPAIEL